MCSNRINSIFIFMSDQFPFPPPLHLPVLKKELSDFSFDVRAFFDVRSWRNDAFFFTSCFSRMNSEVSLRSGLLFYTTVGPATGGAAPEPRIPTAGLQEF